MLVSDVDDTLLGDEAALQALFQALPVPSESVIVAYNSSRPCASLRRSLAATPLLPAPDYLIGALGTEIEEGRSGRPLAAYQRKLAEKWDREGVAQQAAALKLRPHPAQYQTTLKASYDAAGSETKELVEQRLKRLGLAARVIFSGDKNLDIIPDAAGKGRAVAYLQRRLLIAPDHVLVAGDSGNDIDMFVPPYKGIVVGNADPILKQLQAPHIYQARAAYAAGVLEGLRYWQVLRPGV